MRIFFFFTFLLTSFQIVGQEQANKLTAKFISGNITIDGVLDEEAWEAAEIADDFWQYFPSDSIQAKHPTRVRILYDERTLYIGIRADAPHDDFVVSSLRRDFSGTSSDNVTLMFDTFKDGTNAFLFGVTPYGVQREALVSGGGEALNISWDMKWQAESRMHETGYVVEMAIPFTSLKFEEAVDSWRFQIYRWNLQTNEQSAWARVPRNQPLSSLAFMGELVFEEPLGKSRTPLAIIPYVNGITAKDYTTGEGLAELKVGGDAKVAIGNSMNLDITVNPDFSNVEVDDIVTNLTRFEVLLPEKRQFFIDNSDLFGSFGSIYRDATPFFSRRIGIARDTLGNLIQNQILGGVRLSGKLNQDWRLGVLNLQTDDDLGNRIASYNNMMLAVQRKVFSRSNIGFFFINRQSFQNNEFLEAGNSFNRVMGIDYSLASKDNRWTGKFYVHKSLQPDDSEGNFSSQATLMRNTRKWVIINDFVYVDQDFRSDLGFIPRKDIFKMGNGIQHFFYPKKGVINRHGVQLLALTFWRPGLDFKKTDQDFRAAWNVEFRNQSTFNLRFEDKFIYLTGSFDPTRTPGAVPLPGNVDYHFNQIAAAYASNMSRKLIFTAESTIGEFFNGERMGVGGQISVRQQPWALLSLAFNYDRIRLPDPHPDADIWLVSPKVDITFSKSLFWSTLIQYSNQLDNLGINSRLQWRYAPLSDLYLVYNDSYSTGHLGPRFRSINLKLTYWLNL
jgi:hypothetical protein